MENITVTNKVNERQVEMMFGKAMCAYANWQEAEESVREGEEYAGGISADEMACMRNAEYEATVRCLEMFVNENIYAIQRAVIARAKEEFGI